MCLDEFSLQLGEKGKKLLVRRYSEDYSFFWQIVAFIGSLDLCKTVVKYYHFIFIKQAGYSLGMHFRGLNLK